jgi:hypothetical protein
LIVHVIHLHLNKFFILLFNLWMIKIISNLFLSHMGLLWVGLTRRDSMF